MAQDHLRKLLDCIFSIHEGGAVDCEICEQQLECLAEKVAAGAERSELLRAVETHLCVCGDCREEFNALLSIIRAENMGLIPGGKE
jgi:hypothetical protein